MAKKDEEITIEEEMQEILNGINAEDNEDVLEGEEAEIDEIVEEDEPEVEQEEPEEEPEENTEEEPEQEEEPEPEESIEPVRPPSSWSAKAKRDFADLPKHIQEEVLKREGDFHNGIAQYREKAEYGDMVAKVIAPYEATIRAKNSTPDQAIGNLLNTAYILENADPQRTAQLVMQIAQEYGADMSVFANTEGYTQPPQEVVQLQQQVAQLSQMLQQQNLTAQQQQGQEATQSIASFSNELDDNGNIKHIYFDDVRDDMADFIEAESRKGRQLSLSDAYDRAIHARPDIRELLISDQQQKLESQRKKERAEKARKAKRQSSVNVTTTGANGKDVEAIGTIDDTMRKTLAEINSGA